MMGKVGLVNILNNLGMDKNIINTSKAKEYLTTHKEFRSDSSITAAETHVIDAYKNNIFYLQKENIEDLFTIPRPNLQSDLLLDRKNGLKQLTDEIEQNVDLIYQLEYLMRGIPVQDTQHSIHLTLQHLRFSSDNEVITKKQVYFMQNDTPLLVLACLFQSFKVYDFSYLCATNETAVICQLFVELCQKAALNCVKLVIGDSKDLSDKKFSNVFNNLVPEVTGIIMEKSDMDSAVDIFLNSVRHPFPLTRIFVQESVYRDFKETIAWKCRSQQKNNTSFNADCTDVIKYENKTFYLDYAGNNEKETAQKGQSIFVEAFRTVNELLSLLNKSQRQLCLSLWSSGVSESNEIALNVNVPIVWINDYCNFEGPPEISQAVFDKTYDNIYVSTETEVIEKLRQCQKAWGKKTFNERYENVIKAFVSVNQQIGMSLIEKNKSYWKFCNFISLQDKSMVMGFHLPIPVVIVNWSHELQHNVIDNPKIISVWHSIAKALINGSAIAYRIDDSRDNDLVVDILSMLASSDLPLAEVKTTGPSDYEQSVEAKVIWTSFGTTFAN